MSDQKKTNTDEFDGESFPRNLILVIIVMLLFFGSRDIEDLTDAPQ